MYNKLSPFISLGLRRFPPSALQQVLVWWGLSDGISAGCVVGINDLLKAICPPKVAHSSTCSPTICSSWQLPQWQDPLQYSVWPWSVWVCVCLIWSCLSPCDGERQLFFVLALQELRWSVCVFVCVWPSRKKPNETVWILLHYIICKVGLVFAVLQTQSWDLTSCLCWPTLHGNPLCAGLYHIDLSSS